jgi:ElaA protein
MIQWHLHRFDELSIKQLYSLMRLRQAVFVVEQKCAFLDLDGNDSPSLHLSAWEADEPLAYLRLLPPEVHPSECPSLGRICTAIRVRREGLGQELMRRGLDLVRTQWPGHDCQIGAQSYLRQFYESFGFLVNGEEYDEDGIMHFPMRWTGKSDTKMSRS